MIVSGWGSTSTGGGSSNKLRQASVPMVSQAQCSEAYSAISRVTIGETKVKMMPVLLYILAKMTYFSI